MFSGHNQTGLTTDVQPRFYCPNVLAARCSACNILVSIMKIVQKVMTAELRLDLTYHTKEWFVDQTTVMAAMRSVSGLKRSLTCWDEAYLLI